MNSPKKSMVDIQIESLAESQDVTLEEAARLFRKGSEHTIDFDNLPKQNHIWIDRGLKYTCENAGHAYHEFWVRRKATV